MLEQRIRTFIIENFLYDAPADGLEGDTSFLDAGIIDSTGVMELIMFLEQEFDIAVEDDEMLPENLDSVDRICQYLVRKGVADSEASASANS